MQFLSTLFFFPFGMRNLLLDELGCLIRIISSLEIPVHGSASGLTMYGDPQLDIIRI